MNLLIGDPHFRKDNIDSVRVFVQFVLQLVNNPTPSRSDTINRVVIMGDFLDKFGNVFTPVRNEAEKFVHLLREHVDVVILVGNHDYPNNFQFCNDTHWMNALKEWDRVTIVDYPIIIDGEVYCPYVPKGRFKEALNLLGDVWKIGRAHV